MILLQLYFFSRILVTKSIVLQNLGATSDTSLFTHLPARHLYNDFAFNNLPVYFISRMILAYPFTLDYPVIKLEEKFQPTSLLEPPILL